MRAELYRVTNGRKKHKIDLVLFADLNRIESIYCANIVYGEFNDRLDDNPNAFRPEINKVKIRNGSTKNGTQRLPYKGLK